MATMKAKIYYRSTYHKGDSLSINRSNYKHYPKTAMDNMSKPFYKF